MTKHHSDFCPKDKTSDTYFYPDWLKCLIQQICINFLPRQKEEDQTLCSIWDQFCRDIASCPPPIQMLRWGSCLNWRRSHWNIWQQNIDKRTKNSWSSDWEVRYSTLQFSNREMAIRRVVINLLSNFLQAGNVFGSLAGSLWTWEHWGKSVAVVHPEMEGGDLVNSEMEEKLKRSFAQSWNWEEIVNGDKLEEKYWHPLFPLFATIWQRKWVIQPIWR